WHIRGHVSEGRSWLETFLAGGRNDAPGARAAAIRAKALAAAAALATEQGDHERAATLADEGLQLYRASGDSAGSARTLSILATVALRHGDYARAMALYEECLAIHRECGDR